MATLTAEPATSQIQESKPAPRPCMMVFDRKPNARITVGDAEAIAKLVVTRRMTESEACALLQIKPAAWFNWKLCQKNSKRNHDITERTRAAFIESQIANMEDAAIGAGPHKRADWRASHQLLSIVSPERYSDRVQAAQEGSKATVQVGQLNVWMNAARAELPTDPKPAQVIDVQSKLLPEPDHKPA